jgi:hypothetical protein
VTIAIERFACFGPVSLVPPNFLCVDRGVIYMATEHASTSVPKLPSRHRDKFYDFTGAFDASPHVNALDFQFAPRFH